MAVKKIKIKDKDKPVKIVYADDLLSAITKYCKSVNVPPSFTLTCLIADIVDNVLTKPYPQLITGKDNQE